MAGEKEETRPVVASAGPRGEGRLAISEWHWAVSHSPPSRRAEQGQVPARSLG